MTSRDLESVALTLVGEGKGILAAAETTPAPRRRFDALGRSTEHSGRAYRELLFASPGTGKFINGVIIYDETIRQKSFASTPLTQASSSQGILAGIKVDALTKPLAGSPPSTIVAGKKSPYQASVGKVATATLRCLRRHVPVAAPGIVFLSGGQSARLPTAHLNAINRLPGSTPRKIRHGRSENHAAGQQALYHRASCNAAACVGKYTVGMEAASPNTDDPPNDWDEHDD
jgi:fructose-bisphosphate aldolase class 1